MKYVPVMLRLLSSKWYSSFVVPYDLTLIDGFLVTPFPFGALLDAVVVAFLFVSL